MLSVWSDNSSLPSFPTLNGDKKTDVLVVGGGIAGLLCAYKLTKSGVNCILLEADRICRGVTQNTTAKITSQHGFIYEKLINRFGVEKAQMYLHANEAALAEYRKLADKIPCDFEIRDNVVYSVNSREKAEKEMRALIKLGVKAEFDDTIPVPVEIEGAVRFKNQAQFNPLKLLSALSQNLPIYEHTKVFEIRDNCAYTASGKVEASRFIIATHFPFMNKHGGYFLKLFQERSYVLALSDGPQIDGMYVDEAPKGMSFR
ncbi:MAG: NAD(P)/FAD-dependent oxidoreductase, partial [Candidatus Fimenecus sp.]